MLGHISISILAALLTVATGPMDSVLPAQTPDSQPVVLAHNTNAVKSVNPPELPAVKSAIGGEITDLEGKPIVNAWIQITDSATGAVVEVRTSANGAFVADSLGAGKDYSVLVRKIGYHPVALNLYTSKSGKPRQLHLRMPGIILLDK